MIQINLIPDIKRELLEAQRVRNLVIFVSMVIAIGCVAVVILSLGILGGQELLKNANKDSIINNFQKLTSIKDAQKSTNIQSQLNQIDDIKNKAPITSRIIDQIKSALSSDTFKYNEISYNPKSSTITISGFTDGFSKVEALRKTIADTKIIYRKEHNDSACTEADAQNNSNGCIMEDLVTDSGSDINLNQGIAVTQSFGDNRGGTKGVNFTISFTTNKNALAFSSKDFLIKSPSKKDVTDSKLQIPDGSFGGGNNKQEKHDEK